MMKRLQQIKRQRDSEETIGHEEQQPAVLPAPVCVGSAYSGGRSCDVAATEARALRNGFDRYLQFQPQQHPQAAGAAVHHKLAALMQLQQQQQERQLFMVQHHQPMPHYQAQPFLQVQMEQQLEDCRFKGQHQESVKLHPFQRGQDPTLQRNQEAPKQQTAKRAPIPPQAIVDTSEQEVAMPVEKHTAPTKRHNSKKRQSFSSVASPPARVVRDDDDDDEDDESSEESKIPCSAGGKQPENVDGGLSFETSSTSYFFKKLQKNSKKSDKVDYGACMDDFHYLVLHRPEMIPTKLRNLELTPKQLEHLKLQQQRKRELLEEKIIMVNSGSECSGNKMTPAPPTTASGDYEEDDEWQPCQKKQKMMYPRRVTPPENDIVQETTAMITKASDDADHEDDECGGDDEEVEDKGGIGRTAMGTKSQPLLPPQLNPHQRLLAAAKSVQSSTSSAQLSSSSISSSENKIQGDGALRELISRYMPEFLTCGMEWQKQAITRRVLVGVLSRPGGGSIGLAKVPDVVALHLVRKALEKSVAAALVKEGEIAQQLRYQRMLAMTSSTTATAGESTPPAVAAMSTQAQHQLLRQLTGNAAVAPLFLRQQQAQQQQQPQTYIAASADPGSRSSSAAAPMQIPRGYIPIRIVLQEQHQMLQNADLHASSRHHQVAFGLPAGFPAGQLPYPNHRHLRHHYLQQQQRLQADRVSSLSNYYELVGANATAAAAQVSGNVTADYSRLQEVGQKQGNKDDGDDSNKEDAEEVATNQKKECRCEDDDCDNTTSDKGKEVDDEEEEDDDDEEEMCEDNGDEEEDDDEEEEECEDSGDEEEDDEPQNGRNVAQLSPSKSNSLEHFRAVEALKKEFAAAVDQHDSWHRLRATQTSVENNNRAVNSYSHRGESAVNALDLLSQVAVIAEEETKTKLG